MYAKIRDGMLVPAPYEKDGTINYDSEANAAQLRADGFKPVTETEKPEGNYEVHYRERKNDILQYWEEFTPPLSEIDEIELALAELYEMIIGG